MDVITLAVAKKFTKDSLKGAGALKGAPCTVKSTSYDADGNSIVVLEWSLTDGSKKTSTVTIKKGIDGKDGKDGEQGETGVSIAGAHFNSNGKIVFELSDGSETAPISLPSASVDISPDSGNVIEQRGNGIFVPETDTSNFVEKEANKSLISDEDKAQIALNKSLIETLNGDESVVGSVAKQIAEALGKLNSLSKEIVDAVPSVADAKDNVIYLLKGEGTTYEMYSVVSLPDGSKNMASLGSTEIDLDGYLTETKAQEIYLALADVEKDTLAKLGTVTEGEVIYLSFNGSKILTLSQIESIVYKKSEVDNLLEAKLDKSAVVKSLDSTKTDDEIPSAKCVFDELEGKINSEQGSVNAGKALVINEEGNVVPGDAGSSAILTTEDKIGDIDKSKLPDGQMVVTPDEDSIIDDSTASGNKTWSSEKINANLGEKVDYKAVVEDGTRYVEDIVTEDINTWLPNDNSSILINLKKASGANYSNFQLLCNKQDSKNWTCIVTGGISTFWRICYVNGVRYIDEIATMDKVANSIIRESKSVLYNLNNVDNIEVAIDIAKSGYKPIAVSLFNSGTHLWFAQGMYFNDTVCNLSLRGVTPTSATNAECKVLVTYIKTS